MLMRLVANVYRRNSMEVAIFAVLAVSSSRSAFGFLPASLAAAPIVGRAGGIMLCVGSLLALAGLLWRNFDDGLLILQVGLAVTGSACVIYAAALFTASFKPATIPEVGLLQAVLAGLTAPAIAFGMSLGIGVASCIRYFQIQAYVRHRKLNGAR